MFGSELLEVAIGLIVVYIFCGVVCSGITEWISRLLSLRSKDLEKHINQLLADPKLAQQIYDHPLIKGLFHRTGLDKVVTTIFPFIKRDGKPTHINSKYFAGALTDILINTGASKPAQTPAIAEIAPAPVAETPADASTAVPVQSKLTLESFLENQMNYLEAGIDHHVKQEEIKKNEAPTEPPKGKKSTPLETSSGASALLKAFLVMAKSQAGKYEESLSGVKKTIEEWYDNAMEQTSKWYRQKARVIIFVIAILLSFGLNIDTFTIAKTLYLDNTIRSTVLSTAEDLANDKSVIDPSGTPSESTASLKKEMVKLHLPIGWDVNHTNDIDPRGLPNSTYDWMIKLVGLFITAVAVSMGAPFWLDVLKKGLQMKQGKLVPK